MSNINVMRKNLGPVTAYKYAVQQGYTGTEQEFATLMASYATVAEEAEAAKDDAIDAKTAAEEAQAAAEAAAEQAKGAIEVDDTLSVKGRAADAAETGFEIDSLKDDVLGSPTKVSIEPVANKFFNTTTVFRNGETTFYRNGYGAASALDGTYCAYVAVEAGDIFEITGGVNATDSVGFYILTDSGNNVKRSSQKGSRTTPTVVKAKEAGFLYVNFYNYNSSTDYIKKVTYKNKIADKVSKIEDDFADVAEITIGEAITENIELTSDHYYNMVSVLRNEGSYFAPGSAGTLSGTKCVKQSVTAGDQYVLNGSVNGTDVVGLYVYTDLDGNVISFKQQGTAIPTVVNISTDGYLYVNLYNFNSQTDYVKHIYHIGGIPNTITRIDRTIPYCDQEIVNFGDSIFGNKRPPDDISTALSKLLSATVYNCGFGGCRMAKHTLSNFDPFSMYRLAYSIANNSWTLQDSAITASESLPSGDGNKLPAYFPEALTLLKSIDFTKVKAITISYGTNDYSGGISIENSENLFDTDYFGGALRYSLETILSAFPHLHVFVCCPTYRFWMDGQGVFESDSDTRANGQGNTLPDFVAKIKDIANAYHLSVIDNYYDLGINKFNYPNWFPANDGTHHNAKGARLIAEHMARVMF